MHTRHRTGMGLVIFLALFLTVGCTKKHIYTEPPQAGTAPAAEAMGEGAGEASATVQGANQSVEIMSQDLPGEEPLPEEPQAAPALPIAQPSEPGLVEQTYDNTPPPDTRPVVETTTPVTPETAAPEATPEAAPETAAAAPQVSKDILDPMSAGAMADEQPMPYEPPADVTADPGHAVAATGQPAVQTTTETPAGTYDQVGLAAWVGAENKGLPTASGELYDPADLTAAHRTYPLNTRLQVTNLENGRSVVVRINDRGPFKKERIVDLSEAAAKELGMVEQGTAQVGVSVVDEAPAAPVAAPAAGGYYIQVGAYAGQSSADEVLDTLVRSGYGQSRVVKASNETVYRVQAGSFATEEEARKAQDYLKEAFPGCFVVKQ